MAERDNMNTYLSIEQVRAQMNQTPAKQVNIKEDTPSFSSILQQKNEEVKFSKHANARLNDRNINLTSNQMDRLNNAKEMSSAKGIKNSLVLMDDYAFIVNVPSSTVITAMDKNETKENVFTNIDGAVIV